jgi:hypothetical protein
MSDGRKLENDDLVGRNRWWCGVRPMQRTASTACRDRGLHPPAQRSPIVLHLVCHKLSKRYYSIFINKSIPIVHCLVCQECWKATAENRVGRSLGWGCESWFLSFVKIQSLCFVSIDFAKPFMEKYEFVWQLRFFCKLSFWIVDCETVRIGVFRNICDCCRDKDFIRRSYLTFIGRAF